MVGMLHEATARFNLEGRFPPQAYIVRIDGTARHFETESDGFRAGAFADYIEKRIDEERGAAVLSIGEVWFADDWDGVGRVSESPNRYEMLAATAEMANNPTLLYRWPIRRDANGTATVAQPCLPVQCDSGLFRLQGSWDTDA